MKRWILTVGLLITVAVRADLVITEVMSNSDHPGGSGNGDWWELYNTGPSSVDLSGYIWNDANNPASDRAVFPSVTIAAEEAICIVDENSSNIEAWKTNVWGLAASVQALTKDDFGGDADFSGLSSGGDSVYLFDADSNLVTSVTFGDSAGGGKTFEWDADGVSLGFSVDGEYGAFTAPADGDGGAGIDVGSPATVADTNAAPENIPPYLSVAPGGTNQVVRDDQELVFSVIASEPLSDDTNDTVTLWADGIPADAVWSPSVTSRLSAVTNVFTWTPSRPQTTNITFYAADADGTNSITVQIEVRPDLDLVVNEYSAVANDKYLGGGLAGDSFGQDSYFGRILANGGNWIELVVMKDHLDLRGWQLYIAEASDYDGDHDIWYGVSTAKQSIVTFTTNAFWSDLRRGTVLTIAEEESITGQSGYSSVSGTDTNFSPETGDWWIHVSTRDEYLTSSNPLLVTTNNVPGDGYGEGHFSVGNSGWEITVRNENGGRVAGPIGEEYGGSGIGSTEAGMLAIDPDLSVNPDDYSDGTNTTFGSLNMVDGVQQSVAWLRAWYTFTNNNCGLVINEFNAVATNQYLDGDTYADSSDADSVLGRIPGNGGDWIELVVVKDHLDVRGWKLAWAEPGAAEGIDFNTSGDDLWYGNEDVLQGTLTFSTNAVWSDLRIGTIVTISENVLMTNENGSVVANGSDAGVDPASGDWWIHVSTLDEAANAVPLVDAADNDDDSPAGSFQVGSKNWQISILDDADALQAGPVGEVWWESGIGSDEVGALESDPADNVDNDDYDDRDESTFSQANVWSGGAESQNLNDVRAWTHFQNTGAGLILNEYNAVSSSEYLGGSGEDSYLGRIQGNGGNWMELVVTQDHLDIRGWKLKWAETGETNGTSDIWYGDSTVEQGVITFATHDRWANLRSGLILVLVEATNEATDVSVNTAADDYLIRVSTLEEADKGAAALVTTESNVSGDGPGNFSVGHKQWLLQIHDASDSLLFGPAGERTMTGVDNLNNDEVARLELDPDQPVTVSDYDDDNDSTFGEPNRWGSNTQDFSGLRTWGPIDTDADSLIDSWENHHFGGLGSSYYQDPDGDGFNNGAEYIAGSDPTNSMSVFSADNSVLNAEPGIEFYGITGRQYRVEWNTDLNEPWSNMVTGISGSNDVIRVLDTNVAVRRYYRIGVEIE